MQTIFIVLNYPKICILNFSVYQKSLLEKWHVIISNQGKPFANWSKIEVSTRDRLHNYSFFSWINTPTITLSTIGGGHKKTKWIQHNIYIFISISISISDVCRLAYCTTFAKCQGWYTICCDNWGIKKQIKQLQKELAEINSLWYGTLPANASRRKNVLRSLKKVSMTPTDNTNQHAIASYVREAIWPGNKMRQKSWSKWRDDKEVCVIWY